jgi:hypothetical protein
MMDIALFVVGLAIGCFGAEAIYRLGGFKARREKKYKDAYERALAEFK